MLLSERACPKTVRKASMMTHDQEDQSMFAHLNTIKHLRVTYGEIEYQLPISRGTMYTLIYVISTYSNFQPAGYPPAREKTSKKV